MKRYLTILFFAICCGMSSHAQCTYANTAFKSGEYLLYNLHFNWKLVWVKVGTATMSTVQTVYNGKNAYRCSLTTQSNGRMDNIFVMRDTLLAYATTSLTPLYFRKGAKEGKRYTVDEVWYTYPGGRSHIKTRRLNNDGTNTYHTETSTECFTDMLNLFLRARSLDFSKWSKGKSMLLKAADGKGVKKATLTCQGSQVIKSDDGRRWKTIVLDFALYDAKKGRYKKIASIYVSDDANHVPVRIDFSMSFGSAKAFLINSRGLKNPSGAIVK